VVVAIDDGIISRARHSRLWEDVEKIVEMALFRGPTLARAPRVVSAFMLFPPSGSRLHLSSIVVT
jgi:hypothetical protein